MGELPKLYDHKPKKAQMKQVKGIDAKSSSTPSSSLKSSSPAISSYYSTGSTTSNVGGGGGGGGGVSKPPEIPKESFARRYKYVWPLLLTVNLAIGAYLFMRTKKKDVTVEEENTNSTPTPIPTPSPSTSIAPSATAAVTETTVPAAQPVRVSDPIPTTQQRELFKWMLEEKRKIKTNDPEEKKRIDEEKAILKQFIRAKSIPTL
ncbi:hypothetical protein RND81_05G248800 [Saponaria officinalis]|uniref:Uncharacterized protein n=1 Tax=Saponaria officinalis TaxID=3572 RepID=A0AAW1KWT1_SAPOF